MTPRQYYDANNADALSAADYGGCAGEDLPGDSTDTMYVFFSCC